METVYFVCESDKLMTVSLETVIIKTSRKSKVSNYKYQETWIRTNCFEKNLSESNIDCLYDFEFFIKL